MKKLAAVNNLMVMMALAVSTLLASKSTALASGSDTTHHHCSWLPHNGYGLAGIKMQEIQGKTVTQFGFIGIYTITPHFGIGGGGFGNAAPVKIKNTSAPGTIYERIHFGYGGIVPEFRIGMDKTLGIMANALLGIGGYNFDNEKKSGGMGYFVAEPHISASIRLYTFLRLNIGAAYRKLYAIGNKDLYTTTIEGASAFCQVQFGVF